MVGGGGAAPTLPAANSLHSFFLIDVTLKALAASIAAPVCCSASSRARLRSLRSLSAGEVRGAVVPQESIWSCLTVQRPPFCLLTQMAGG